MCIIIWQLQEFIGGQFTPSAHYHNFLHIWLLLCDGLKAVMTCDMITLLIARYSSLLGLDTFPHLFSLFWVCNFFF